MAKSLSLLHEYLIQLSKPILDSISTANYTPPEGSNFSTKSILESLLPHKTSPINPKITEEQIHRLIKDLALACALLSSSRFSNHDVFSWIPEDIAISADAAFCELSKTYLASFGHRNLNRLGELGVDCGLMGSEKRLVVELMPEFLPYLKGRIKESLIDKSDEGGEVTAACAGAPVGNAIVAAYQFRWFVTQVDYTHLGKLCSLMIPCGLTALDHWSPEVKGQGMISFIHLAKNVNYAELGGYEDVILDACVQNIASADEIWHHVVEMSVLLVTCIQQGNPRSLWFEKILNEMLSHLERQPRHKERRIAWLELIEPLLHSLSLVLLVHFRRLFPLFFKWMHADDDQTVILVLERVHIVMKLTWIRNTPYVGRLIDELVVLYKESAMKKAREDIRRRILQILILLQQCKGIQFEAAWEKYRDDPNLTGLSPSLNSGSLII